MFDDFGEEHEPPQERPRDNKVDAAKEVLLARFFPDDSRAVYYGRQLARDAGVAGAEHSRATGHHASSF
jgi:hypothetical protein